MRILHEVISLRLPVNYQTKQRNVSQRAHDVKTTSCQRRCDVITSHRRGHNVILAPNARWVMSLFSEVDT